MKIFLLLIFVILTNSKSFQPNIKKEGECDKTYWGNNGETCNDIDRKCKNFYKCKNGKCTYSNIGSACEQHSDCFLSDTSEKVVCINKVCTKRKYNGWGCDHDGECYGGLCKDQICHGKKLGEDCDPSALVQCEKELYCSKTQRKCVKQLSENAPCDDYELPAGNSTEGGNFNVICKGGFMCMNSPREGGRKCEKFKGGLLNYPCNLGDEKDNQCAYGLHCSAETNTCLRDKKLDETLPCKGSPRNCIVSQHEICACTLEPSVGKLKDGEGQCLPTVEFRCDLFGALTRWRDCAMRYNCPLDADPENAFLIDSLEKKTCMGINCGWIAREYMCCAHQPYRRQKHSPVSIGPLNCPTGIDGVATFFIILFVLITLGIVVGVGVVVLVIVYRKKGENKFEILK